jgi:BRCA1-associated protein
MCVDNKTKLRWCSPGPVVATYVPQSHTKSGTTNLPNGVVHLYRDIERQKAVETDEGTSAPDASRIMLENADTDGYMVGVLAVPSWMTPSDFLAFVAPAEDGMAHLRMIRYVFVSHVSPIHEALLFTEIRLPTGP